MKHLKLIAIIFIFWSCKNNKSTNEYQDLIVIDQNYKESLKIASEKDKLIFIDFYTTWCAPCKKLDKLVFKNDSIKKILKKDFILLKYNAENDTVFHLSKKHHISSYPTGLILNKKGYVLNRKYGFPGEDFLSLSKIVLKFTNESILLNNKNKIIKGYSNKIDEAKYPQFYIDYVNRTNTKINPLELNEYWSSNKNVLSEQYFSTLIYFARDASDNVANKTLKNINAYKELYGNNDVEILMYFLTSGKFSRAISEKNQLKYDEAVLFAKNALSVQWTDDILPNFEKEFTKTLNE
ncbi:thioredoxin family protein [Polaribacter batillariae]|uniref:Thioredoxin family protein n=1 Tax=Polaribacter batillariae TaxID=2808900 RepID=A0ABX7T262_9FLAO|nr:thioredoxin family protein [Polaribacter batillariae]QTD39133.1 thioredoxin family protein [Polaribacter batillariae]